MTENGYCPVVIQMLFNGDRDTDPALTRILQVLGNEWGPLGVAREAVHLVWPEIAAREVIVTVEPEPSRG
jgi:hypothetical protein